MDAKVQDAIRIACCNHKGGVGKTTCAVNLAAGLAQSGQRVLAIDADPQAHLTASLGISAAGSMGLAAVLRQEALLEDALVEADGLAVLPATGELATVETELSRQNTPDTRLAVALAAVTDFDLIVFDCPPHLGPLTRQVLGASTRIIVPMIPDYLSMQSLAWLMGTLNGLTEAGGTGPTVLGILFNRFSSRKKLHREVRKAVAGHFPGLPFESSIRENIALAEAPSHGQDIFHYAPTSAGAQDFTAICRETSHRIKASGTGQNGRTAT